MGNKFNYTTLAYRYTARFPVSTYLGTQVNFWIVANLLLITLLNFQSRIISITYHISISGSFPAMLLISALLGIVYGLILGATSYYLDKKLFRNKALGKLILFKTLTSLSVIVLILVLIRYVFFDFVLAPYMPSKGMTESAWRSLFFLLMIYYLAMTLIISFINLINKKYGPGILLPLLFGRYRDPKEEDRIFMFMDLKSSTTTAEELGHLKYSAFIRDCFSDINEVLYPFRAQVYQYVGDEIVLTWPEDEGLKNHFCLGFYFACRKQFHDRSSYYMTNYGFLPEFKAGIHTGTVAAVEIGEFKRDIAYHGDTLNTASRIQGVCNEYNKSFLASQVLLDKLGAHPSIRIKDLGKIMLKGKTTAVGIASVEWP